MSKVMFVDTLYGQPRGHSYVNRDMIVALKNAGHQVYMCKINREIPTEEFPKLDGYIEYPNEFPKDVFEKYLDEIKPDYCIFNEYNQWAPITYDKLALLKEKGIPSYGFLVWERLDFRKKEHYKLYDKIICPTGFQTRLLRRNGLYNTVHIPWGVDLKEIDSIENTLERPKDKKLIFFHCAGTGGVADRKNTQAVIDAYKLIEDETTQLIITDLRMKAFSREDIIKLTKMSDVIVNSARWDTMGLNTFEANICSKPVLVCKMDPMTELVRDTYNGFCVEGRFRSIPEVSCPICDVDISELSKKMAMFKSEYMLELMKSNSRKFAEVNFDWNKNQKYFLELFEVKNE